MSFSKLLKLLILSANTVNIKALFGPKKSSGLCLVDIRNLNTCAWGMCYHDEFYKSRILDQGMHNSGDNGQQYTMHLAPGGCQICMLCHFPILL